MDILIFVFGSMTLFFTGAAMFAFLGEGYKGNVIAGRLALVNVALVGLIVWTACAVNTHIKEPANMTKISCPIQSAFNTAFYVDESGKPHEITGDARFADPTTTEMVVIKTSGGWKWGIYVTEGRTLTLEKKALPEAQK